MNTIEINGKPYEKASVLAKKTGYTSDYIGQLCRAEKIEATLVGRTWYIQPDSLKAHKSTRYRSTSKKTTAALKDEVSEIRVRTSGAPRQRHIAVHSYEEDASDLLPRLQKLSQTRSLAAAVKKSIAAAVEPATVIAVNSFTPATVLRAEKLPEVAFGGTIKVTALDDLVEEENPPLVTTPAKPRRIVPLRSEDEAPAPVVATAQHTERKQERPSARRSVYPVLATVGFATAVCLAVFLTATSLESTVEVASAGQSTGWNFNVDFVLETIENALK